MTLKVTLDAASPENMGFLVGSFSDTRLTKVQDQVFFPGVQ